MDSTFVIQAIKHSGDTRGDEYYTNMVCTALGAVVPKSGITINAVDDDWTPEQEGTEWHYQIMNVLPNF